MRDLDNSTPVVLITGGGSGIGAAIAHRLAGSHRVVICGRRREPLERVALETGALAVTADVSDEGSCSELVNRILEQFGRIDQLVLNAGIVEAANVSTMSVQSWRRQIDVNLNGPFIVAKQCLPHLVARAGAIVAISSIAAQRTGPGLSAYSASKAGLTLLTQSIAFENARFGLRANVVCPGWTRTEMSDREVAILGGGAAVEGYRRVSRWVPQRRVSESREVAELVVWLLSPLASYLNGSVINVDGGESIVCPSLVEFDE
jgi:meso-butanediol dehydrogenase / (S,S)-butanediol dehydrogenase / diacetyl reductase